MNSIISNNNRTRFLIALQVIVLSILVIATFSLFNLFQKFISSSTDIRNNF